MDALGSSDDGGPVPVPFEAALQYEAGAARSEIETGSEVNRKKRRRAPVTAEEYLMDFRLRSWQSVYALDFPIVFD
jgi:hypothetical protein